MHSMNRSLRVALAILVSLVTFTRAEAQSADATLTPDLRVRVMAPPYLQKPRVGRVDRVVADTLFLRTRDTLHAVPLAAVASVQVNHGSRAMRGAGRGALIGALTGGMLFATMVWFSDPNCDYCLPGRDQDAARVGFAIGGVLGVAPGALVGAIVGIDRWQPLPAAGQGSEAAGGGVRAGLVVRH